MAMEKVGGAMSKWLRIKGNLCVHGESLDSINPKSLRLDPSRIEGENIKRKRKRKN